MDNDLQVSIERRREFSLSGTSLIDFNLDLHNLYF